jgi:hypothetical protein
MTTTTPPIATRSVPGVSPCLRPRVSVASPAKRAIPKAANSWAFVDITPSCTIAAVAEPAFCFVDGGEALEDIGRFVGHAKPTTTAGYVKRLGRRPEAVAKRGRRRPRRPGRG